MRLGGWIRLWIVASVVWWGAGTWWIARGDYRASPLRMEMPPLVFTEADYCPNGACRPCEGGEGPWCEQQEGTSANRKAGWAKVWSIWIDERWRAGELPVLLFAPFAVLLLGAAGWWVARGFSPRTAGAKPD